MSIAEAKKQFTPEDLLRIPDGNRFELVDGELVELNVGAYASYVAGRAFALVHNHNEKKPQGWPFHEGTSYQCFPDAPRKVRRPDTSFVRFGRFPDEKPPEGHIQIAPDLAVEVVSPNDSYYEVNEKVEEFLRARVPLVWVIDPNQKTVNVRRPDGRDVTLRENDELTGEDVLLGFRCKVAELFAVPSGAAVGG
jgi:Uma2 family endonuclease